MGLRSCSSHHAPSGLSSFATEWPLTARRETSQLSSSVRAGHYFSLPHIVPKLIVHATLNPRYLGTETVDSVSSENKLQMSSPRCLRDADRREVNSSSGIAITSQGRPSSEFNQPVSIALRPAARCIQHPYQSRCANAGRSAVARSGARKSASA
jgi:hypothetical protein